MGNHRFRLADMMPNAWFHKLKVMGRASRNATTLHTSKKPHPTRTGGPSTPKPLPPPPHPPAEPPYLQPRRASYYFPSRQEKGPGGPSSPVHPRASDTLFPIDPPRKSKKKSRRKQPRPSHKLVSSAGSWSCRATLGAVWQGEAAMLELPPSPETPRRRKEDQPDGGGGGGEVLYFDKLVIAEHYENCDSVEAWSRSCSCKLVSPVAEDVVMDMGSNSSSSTTKFAEIGLRPILTKQPANKASPKPCTKLEDDAKILSSKPNKSHKLGSFPPPKETQKSSLRRPSPAGTQGLRIRATSPRLASKKVVRAHRSRKAAATTPRKGLSESFAVVKSSSDPQRDFRDSMMEMIVANNIRASTDLEDLLACYLSLNANEYHDVIVKVFEQIWFDLTDVRCREVHR